MANQQSEPVKTFTIGFAEQGFNEFEYASEVAFHCHSEHKEIILDVNRYMASLQTMLQIKDAPLAVPNEIALHELSKILKKDITVVLSGEGADELFGGYGRIFRSAYDYQRVVQYSKGSLPNSLGENLLKKYNDLNWTDELDHFISQYSYMNFSAKEQILWTEILTMLGNDPHNRGYFSQLWKKLDGLDLHEKYMWIFQRVAKALKCDYYFAHPYSSWERGLNENTNGLIRQFFPKGSSFEGITEQSVKRAKGMLNRRPRKTLGHATSTEVFFGKRIGVKIALQS